MLTIRNDQIRALAGSVSDRLTSVAVNHIRLSLPDLYAEMGADQVRESVLLAYSKASTYEMAAWSDVLAYLNVMYILGFEFDEDPRYPWAAQILRSAELQPGDKSRLLLDNALEESQRAHASAPHE